MLGSYLQSAARNAAHNPLYAIVNVVGLAIGLACCTLILLFVLDEFSYDRMWKDADNIYRVNVHGKPGSGFDNVNLAALSGAGAPQMLADFAEVEKAARLFPFTPLISRGDSRFYEDGFFYADPNFFEIFDVTFVEGDPATALSEPNTVVLSESLAAKYFGSEDPIGQTLNYGGIADMQVTGIYRDLPHNTHLRGDLFSSMDTLKTIMGPEQAEALMTNWGGGSFYTYVVLSENVSGTEFEADLPEFLERHMPPRVFPMLGWKVQAVTDIHLRSKKQQEIKPGGNLDFAWMLAGIAAAILSIAVINFANLTTARGTLRAKEVGVRKVAGATRSGIASQFLLESGLFVLLAICLGLALAQLALPWFNGFAEKNVSLALMLDMQILAPAIGAMIVVIGLAGAYPALYLSGFRPAIVMTGSSGNEGGSGRIRRALVVLQFAISVGLGIATAIVYQQMNYARTMPLGYQKEDVVVVRYNPRREEQVQAYNTLMSEWRQHPDIAAVTAGSNVPTGELLSGGAIVPEGGDPDNPIPIRIVDVDYDYFKTFNIDLIAGRTFSMDHDNSAIDDQGSDAAADSETTENQRETVQPIILNETAARGFGYSDPFDAAGQQLRVPQEGGPTTVASIVGVVGDIYFTSIHSAIQPQAYVLDNDGSTFAIRLTGRNRKEALRHIDETWDALVPSYPITRSFLEDRFDALYQDEERAAQIFAIFTGVSFLVAGLGLFGLAAFATGRRTKEIGVRKVLGASVASIVALMTWDFSKLVVIASVIAAPIAWYAMQGWLESYAYRAGVNPMIFASAILAAFLLSTLVVLFHATRAASVRPAMSLKDE